MSDTATLSRLGMVLMNASAPAVETPGPGVYPNVPAHVYHQWDCASNSQLGHLKRSPAHLIAELQEPKDARHFAIGRAAHAAILEPDTFATNYVVAQQCGAIKKDKERCSNGGIVYANGEWFCGVHGKGIGSQAGPVSVLSERDHADILRMRESVLDHRSASKLTRGKGQNELSCVWIDPETGVKCKARLDRHSPVVPGCAIVDVKTTEDASKASFYRSIYKWGYYRQAYFYLQAAKHCGLPAEFGFIVVAVEKAAPYGVGVYRVIEAAVDAGEQEVKALLKTYAECRSTGHWPAYSDDVVDITLPDFAWSQIIETQETAA
jgi:hypothetical protein